MPSQDPLAPGKARNPTILVLLLLSAFDAQPKPQKPRDRKHLPLKLLEKPRQLSLCYPKLHIYTPSTSILNSLFSYLHHLG